MALSICLLALLPGLVVPASDHVAAAAATAGVVPPDASAVALSLADALARARAHSARLEQLSALDAGSLAGVRAAQAARRPLVDLGAGYTRNSSVPELAISAPGVGTLELFPDIPNTWRARVAATLPLYTGGRTQAGLRAALAQREAAGLDLRAGQQDLVLETTTAYWTLVTTRATERVLAEALASYEQHLKDAQHRAEVGLAARNEVLAVQVERERAELGRVQAANAALLAQAELARLVGLDLGATLVTTETLDARPVPAEDAGVLAAAAREARPELQALRARVQAADAQVGVQRAAALPQAGLSAGYDLARPNTRVLPLRDEFDGTWSVGVNLTWNAFDGGRSAAAVSQARAQADALRAQLREVERRVALEVRARLLDIDAAEHGLAVSVRAHEAARENVRVSADRYREGVASSSDLLDAETGLLRAGLDRTAAQSRLVLAHAGLDRAVGR